MCHENSQSEEEEKAILGILALLAKICCYLFYFAPFLGLMEVLSEKISFSITGSTLNMNTTILNCNNTGTKQAVAFFDIFRTDSSNGTNVANPIDKDNIIGNAEQIQLTNMQASGAPSWRQGAPLASISVSWICKESPIIGLFQ